MKNLQKIFLNASAKAISQISDKVNKWKYDLLTITVISFYSQDYPLVNCQRLKKLTLTIF